MLWLSNISLIMSEVYIHNMKIFKDFFLWKQNYKYIYIVILLNDIYWLRKYHLLALLIFIGLTCLHYIYFTVIQILSHAESYMYLNVFECINILWNTTCTINTIIINLYTVVRVSRLYILWFSFMNQYSYVRLQW